MSPGRRAVSPVVGVVSLVAVVVVLAATVGAVALEDAPPEPAPSVSLDVAATDDGRVTLTHRDGATLSAATLRVRLAVDGEPLAHQPPVPFVGAPGYPARRPARSTPRATGRGAQASVRPCASPGRTRRRSPRARGSRCGCGRRTARSRARRDDRLGLATTTRGPERRS